MDWTKITKQFVGYQTFTGPGEPTLTNEVVQIATGFKGISDATKNLFAEGEAAKEIIDTTDLVFPTDVARVYNKVQQLQCLYKLNIITFWNTLTLSTSAGGIALGTTINKSFIEWLATSKTFLINENDSSFWILKYASSTKKKDFYKSISMMT